jgi:hypothetical protein
MAFRQDRFFVLSIIFLLLRRLSWGEVWEFLLLRLRAFILFGWQSPRKHEAVVEAIINTSTISIGRGRLLF